MDGFDAFVWSCVSFTFGVLCGSMLSKVHTVAERDEAALTVACFVGVEVFIVMLLLGLTWADRAMSSQERAS